MTTIYARKECARDLRLQNLPASPAQRDVQLYRDAAASIPAGRFPWHHVMSKPTRRNRYVVLNCVRYRLAWLPDFPA